MFFNVDKIEQEIYSVDGLQNPKDKNNPMGFGLYRTFIRTLMFRGYSKQAFGEFWDDATGKLIPRRLWTTEMKAFAREKVAGVSKPPFVFKMTIAGWIFVVLIIALFIFLAYEEFKTSIPK